MDYRTIPIFEPPVRQQKGTKQGVGSLAPFLASQWRLMLDKKEEKIDSVAPFRIMPLH
ncbi:hypothetical protein SC029_08850 [Legionella pneumophila serogroup 1]|uniref:hypothetical protein n=1 Tax=Legionella pneumophila TaxID=446 RepID=UPI000A48ADBE|nr:hypothetical protein [Legionella pneumophila]HAT1941440.1 hypothetical protein [Legionella pneumophila]HAT3860523.1 hypothetical protein [Legionella pneumophila]HDK8303970.1 hypothetical protein [Legionella pneumophila]HDO7871668.1 hypothetical protein [Legionella pneumophila]HDO7939593.1 hypothetical protein [Legionella pneumophila]